MRDFYLLIDTTLFHEHIQPALTASGERHRFQPCVELCRQLLPRVAELRERYHLGAEEPLLTRVASLPFDRHIWTMLVGEILFHAALALPEVENLEETLTCFLPPETVGQLLYGSRDLTFGRRIYRPEEAGWNDAADVRRLAAFLPSPWPTEWTVEQLRPHRPDVEEDELLEELEMARDWWPALCGMYEQARAQRCVLVWEYLGRE